MTEFNRAASIASSGVGVSTRTYARSHYGRHLGVIIPPGWRRY
ncbi:hypothetical protein PN499_29515 [Kamptonema animale CS-326]|nr:hypothetical protein [Kamptonema animale]MDB9515344.1 hypothetical protein [Kamptonema animale CS-326]